MEAVFRVRKFPHFSDAFSRNSCSFWWETAGSRRIIPPSSGPEYCFPFASVSGAFLPKTVILPEFSARFLSFPKAGINALDNILLFSFSLIYTGWRKSHVIETKLNIFMNGSSRRADFLIDDRGMFKLYIDNIMYRMQGGNIILWTLLYFVVL